MNHPAKKFWFCNYWWIAPAVAGGAILAALSILWPSPEKAVSVVLTAIGGALGIVYFVQKQMLEEVQLFERLFTQFNQRYATLNDDLECVRAGTLTDEARVRRLLNDYFNLCAEEYLFYSQGRIHPAAWRSWCRGMDYYRANDLIRGRWEAELAVGSSYGLTLAAIQAGASLTDRQVQTY